MTRTLRVDAEAEIEIAEAIERYDREREGLGVAFWSTVSDALDTLVAPGPECGPIIGVAPELGIRRKLLSRFPYAIVFIETDTTVRVISVMHGRRLPAYWLRRL
ncbi:MAG TPA: hypothetical protein VGC42_30830 [Kofleriaceae bacterium]